MKIEHYLYQLEFKENYGTVGQGSFREGALLRVTFDDEQAGYCDCHPWVELGDAPLSEQLRELKSGKKTPLLERSLYFAKLDAKARQEGRSLFDGLEIPLSHRLVSLSDPLTDLIAEGVTHFKLKTGKNREIEIASMASWVEKNQGIKLRLDFNEKYPREEFLSYWKSMPKQVLNCIDFVEDPYPYDPELWCEDQKVLNIKFAADHAAAQALKRPETAAVIVHKPAVEASPVLTDQTEKLVITTYLDHPLGQMCAAYAAAILKRKYPHQVGFCGLLTHECYKNNPFVDSVRAAGPKLLAPKGTGFGFNELLGGLLWQNC